MSPLTSYKCRKSMANPTTFHGVWWVPEEHPFLEKRFSGTLTYFGDKNSILELIHEPKSGAIRIDHSYDVLWGEDAEGGVYSLFGVTARTMSFTKFEFVIRFILHLIIVFMEEQVRIKRLFLSIWGPVLHSSQRRLSKG